MSESKKYRAALYRREAALLRNYGIGIVEYDEMLTKQDGCCAICGIHALDAGTLCVDHDHNSGRIRALLCHGCNKRLGQIEAKGLDKFLAYIKRFA